MRNKELYIAFCFSLAVHGAVIGFTPLQRAESDGLDGRAQDIVVLGVARITPSTAAESAPEPLEEEVVAQAEHKRMEEIEPPRFNDSHVLQPPEPEKPQPVPESEQASASTREIDLHGRNIHDEIPGKPEPAAGETENIRSAYLKSVMRKLENAKTYPVQAHRNGIEGTVEIRFSILTDGGVGEIEKRRSSGYGILDSAAAKLVARASPFDPIPDELGTTMIRIVAPVKYSLDQ